MSFRALEKGSTSRTYCALLVVMIVAHCLVTCLFCLSDDQLSNCGLASSTDGLWCWSTNKNCCTTVITVSYCPALLRIPSSAGQTTPSCYIQIICCSYSVAPQDMPSVLRFDLATSNITVSLKLCYALLCFCTDQVHINLFHPVTAGNHTIDHLCAVNSSIFKCTLIVLVTDGYRTCQRLAGCDNASQPTISWQAPRSQ